MTWRESIEHFLKIIAPISRSSRAGKSGCFIYGTLRRMVLVKNRPCPGHNFRAMARIYAVAVENLSRRSALGAAADYGFEKTFE
jgi:hypothetical protein